MTKVKHKEYGEGMVIGIWNAEQSIVRFEGENCEWLECVDNKDLEVIDDE